MKLIGSGDYDGEFAKTHFVNGLSDKFLADTAITGGWTLAQTVAAASRRESYKLSSDVSPFATTSAGVSVAAVQNKQWQQRPPERQSRQQNLGSWSGRKQGGACTNCGNVEHARGVCPAIGKACRKCDRMGHFKRQCRSNAQRAGDGSGQAQIKNLPSHMIKCEIGGGTEITFTIDSGADENTLSEID